MHMRRWIIRLLTASLFLIIMPVSMAAQTKGKQQEQPKEKTQEAPKAPPVPPAQQITLEQVDFYVKHYSGFGQHRAGSRIDRRAATWIRKTLKRNKLEVSVEKFQFRRPVSRYAVVSMKIDRINNVILPGMPLFNAKPTNRHVSARLGFVGQDGTVPVIHIYVTPSSGSAKLRSKSLKQFKDAVKSGRYKAVIGVTQGGYAGLVPLAIDLNKKYKTPAMLMSSEIGNFAEVYAEINNPVKFLTRLNYKNATGENIIGKIEGTQPNLAPIVVVVPRSAWWYAAAERGTGVASWMAAAKTLATVKHKRTIWFVSTTGQEFYSLGLKEFLKAHPELEKNAYAWIYVGGNVGTVPKPHYIVQGSSRSIRRQVKKAFEQFNIEHVRWLDAKPIVLPPMAPIFDHSKHAVIIAATNNKCARMTCDKWPANVNLDATFEFSKALTVLIQNLAAEE